MRPLVLCALAGVVLLGGTAAHAAVPVVARTPGAELFELRGGNGRAAVSRLGSIFLSVRTGRVRIVDLPGGKRPFFNCGSRTLRRISSTTVEVRGTSIRCRVWSGDGGRPWQVIMRGRGISASGVVRGSLTLDAVSRGAPGTFRIGDGDLRRWPRNARTFVLRSE
ncbi:MAG TPA: hypothetical protein VD704_05075 [Gaiellaceae bacterium]|nr:hypothetical protein [Gaiellaceae bacterium]